jgi:hypothetical protein
MIFGSGRPSVNVDGHCTLSGSVVVVTPVVSSVDGTELVVPRRGILGFDVYTIAKERSSTKKAVVCLGKNDTVASVVSSNRVQSDNSKWRLQ